MHLPSFVRSLCLTLGWAVVVPVLPGAAAEDPSQGLVQTVTSGGVTDLSVTPNVWLFVPAGQPATPFVPAGPFTAKWEGSVSADLRGDFTFHALVRGALKVTVNGAMVLEAKDTGAELAIGQSVRLNKGTNAFVVDFTSPPMGEAMVRLYWTNRETPLNPIPLPQLSHAASDALTRSLLVHQGRDLLLENRCVMCHSAAGSVPELKMDAPTLNGIGARRNADWMARWIQDPHALRPGTPMPQIFTGATAKADAEAVAAYLATLKGDAKFEPTPGDVAVGQALFEKLHCVACHLPPEGGDTKPHQISQKQVKAKFTPGALAAFLRRPEEHFKWIRMPNFKLNSEEAANLAAYLDSVADAAEVKPVSTEATVIEQGKKLVSTVGCLNCHTLDGSKNEFTAKPLSDLGLAGHEVADFFGAFFGQGLGLNFFGGALLVMAVHLLAELGERDVLQLADALAGDFEFLADLFQRHLFFAFEAEAQLDDAGLARVEGVDHGREVFLEVFFTETLVGTDGGIVADEIAERGRVVVFTDGSVE